MSTFIKRDLPNNEYQAAITANTPSGTNPYATIADLPQAVSSGTQLLTGGASWSGTGMIFDVTTLTYQIDGVNYSSTATTVTLPVGDPLNPRFDAIVVDEFGVVSFISGIPSANPVTPTIPGNQVLVQYVLVGAGAVVPNITDEWTYRESQAGDWIGSIIGGAPAPTAVWNSPTPAPFAGTACLLASYSAYSTTRYIRFQAPAPISRSTYVGLTLRVYLSQDFTTLDGGLGRRPFIQLRGGPSLTSFGTRYLDAHGLNRSLVGVWQQVTIPTALFTANAGVTDIRVIDLFLLKNATAPNTYVDIAYDNIVFQTGFGTTSALPTIDIAQNGTIIGDTPQINFIDGINTTVTVTDDIPNNKIDVKVDAVSSFGKIGISDVNGEYTYYSDLSSAAAASISGDTIVFFTDITDISSTTVILPDGVDINLNGFTYTLNNAGTNNSIQTTPSATNNIFNGIIDRVGGGFNLTNSVALSIDNSTLYLTGVTVKSSQVAIYANGANIFGSWSVDALNGIYADTSSCIFERGKIFSVGDAITNAVQISVIDFIIESTAEGIVATAPVELTDSLIFSAGGSGINTTSSFAGYNSTIVSSGNCLVSTQLESYISNCTLRSSTSTPLRLASGNTGGIIMFNSNLTSATNTVVDISTTGTVELVGNTLRSTTASAIAGIRISATSTNIFKIYDNYIYIISSNISGSTTGITISSSSTPRIDIVNNNIEIFSVVANSRCIGGTASVYYSSNSFRMSNGQPAVAAGITQSVTSTSDNYGNILIG